MFTALRTGTAAVMLMLLTSGATPAVACGFDGVLDGNFSALHPKSIVVALAIRDAVDAGVVDKSAVDPIVRGSAGYWRAVGHLNAFRQRLSTAAGQSQPPSAVAVLFIDSALWARLAPSSQGFDIEVHTSGPQSGDVVLVTSEAILTAMLEGHLSVQAALDHELLVIDGPSGVTEKIRQLLMTGLSHQSLGSPIESMLAQKVRLLFGRKQ
jgi:hypothetical protein